MKNKIVEKLKIEKKKMRVIRKKWEKTEMRKNKNKKIRRIKYLFHKINYILYNRWNSRLDST